VLLVDDNLDAAETLAMVLDLQGFETRVAPDGPRALEMAGDFRPDVAVLDIGLPVMDGNELARHLRHRQPDLRIVALTGYGTRGGADASVDAQFDARLLKPVELPTLLAAITPQSPAAPSD
jgi:CheY-like chemotaxis protein